MKFLAKRQSRFLLFGLLTFAWLQITPLVSHAQEFVPGEVIVKLKGKATSSKTQSFASKAQSDGVEHLKSWSGSNLHHMQGKVGQSTEALMAAYKADPNVEYVEPNYILRKQSDEVSAQGYSYSQVATFVTGFGLTSAPMQGVEAWGEITASNLPIVAVIDTGIDLYHPALSGALWTNTNEIANNGVDDDHNGFVDDVHGWNFVDGNNYNQDCDGHGTHVSGIVRGTTQYIFDPNTLAAANVRIMAVKFLDCSGSGSTSAAIDAIYYAVNMGAKVLNNSWGGGGYSRALHEAIVYSYNARTLFVAAAGNSSANNDSSKTYPASYDVPNVISVAATTPADALASFSNFGAGTVPVAAPGYSILSTYIDYGGCPANSGCFTWLSGTSMAAPFVAGMAALMINEKPTMTGYQVKNLIQSTVDSKSGLSGKVSTSGRVNSLNALVAAKTAAVDPNQPFYEIGLSSEDRGVASAIASGGAGGCGIVQALRNGGGGAGSGSSGGTPYGRLFVLSVLLMIPILVTQYLRRSQVSRRAHPRFAVESQLKLSVDGVELEGALSTISVGGAGIDTRALLEKGSLVTLKIQAPDGKEMEVQGRVVWKAGQKQYGVQFVEANPSVLKRLRVWTARLVPTS